MRAFDCQTHLKRGSMSVGFFLDPVSPARARIANRGKTATQTVNSGGDSVDLQHFYQYDTSHSGVGAWAFVNSNQIKRQNVRNGGKIHHT